MRTTLRAAIVVAALAVVALPATAQARPGWIVNNASPYWCLDSNANTWHGDVYLNPCQSGNPYQLWESWEGGWTRNVATGRCLAAEAYGHPNFIFAPACVWNGVQQHWRHWQGGWKQRQAYNNNITVGRAVCLARASGWPWEHEVTGVECRNPNGPNPPEQEWDWVWR